MRWIMGKTATIQARVDAKTKSRAVAVLKALGLNITEAVNIYLRQIVLTKSIPFEVKIPNELTAKTLAKSAKGEDLHEVSNIEELFEEIDA